MVHPAAVPDAGAEVGAGLGSGQTGEAAVDQQGGQGQGFPHGGAGTVQPEKGDAEVPQAEGGADALVQQVPGQHAVQLSRLQSRLVQRPLQNPFLHGRLRLFPGLFSEKGVVAQFVKIFGQRALALHPPADIGEGQHRGRRLQGRRPPPDPFAHGASSLSWIALIGSVCPRTGKL